MLLAHECLGNYFALEFSNIPRRTLHWRSIGNRPVFGVNCLVLESLHSLAINLPSVLCVLECAEHRPAGINHQNPNRHWTNVVTGDPLGRGRKWNLNKKYVLCFFSQKISFVLPNRLKKTLLRSAKIFRYREFQSESFDCLEVGNRKGPLAHLTRHSMI